MTLGTFALACTGWLALDCVLAPLLGALIRGPAHPEPDQQQARDVNAKVAGRFGERRMIDHFHNGSNTDVR